MDKTAEEGCCSTARLPKGKIMLIIFCSCIYRNKVIRVCCSCLSDLSLNESWQWDLNKTIYCFVEQYNLDVYQHVCVYCPPSKGIDHLF